MNLLAFDTSTQTMGIALHYSGQTYCVTEEGGANASGRLIPLIMQHLAAHALQIKDLNAIAFGCGPGAFTGLRTACAVAQGLAMGAQKPLISIVTLQAAAEQYRLQVPAADFCRDVVVRLDARMNEWYWAHYQWSSPDSGLGHDTWHTITPPCLSSPETLQHHLDHLPKHHLVTMEDPQMTGMVALAQKAWQAGATIAPQDALPLYLRNKVALTTAERMQQQEANRLEALQQTQNAAG